MTATAYNSNIYSTRQRGNVDAALADMRIRLNLLSIDIKQFDTADIPCIHSKDEQTLADNRHAYAVVPMLLVLPREIAYGASMLPRRFSLKSSISLASTLLPS